MKNSTITTLGTLLSWLALVLVSDRLTFKQLTAIAFFFTFSILTGVFLRKESEEEKRK